MTVTPDVVAVELGRPTPLADDEAARIQSWIDQALYLIGRRYEIDSLDPADVDYVVLMAVAEHARHADSAKRVTVSVDDGSVSKEYETASARVSIWPDLWDILDGGTDVSGVGSTQMFGEPDTAPAGWGPFV